MAPPKPDPSPLDHIPQHKPTHQDWVRAVNEQANIRTPRKGNKRTGY